MKESGYELLINFPKKRLFIKAQMGNAFFSSIILIILLMVSFLLIFRFYHREKEFSEERFVFVDSTFFEIFTFPFIAGDPNTALDRPYTVVITEEMKIKYFGDEDPIGKVLKINGEQEYEITGVCETPPSQSSIEFDFLGSMTGRGRTSYSKFMTLNSYKLLFL